MVDTPEGGKGAEGAAVGADGVHLAVVGADGGLVDLGPETVNTSKLGIRLKEGKVSLARFDYEGIKPLIYRGVFMR